MANTDPQTVFTFISRCAPYGSGRPQVCLDAALAAAVFEQEVNYVFMDDGVYQLLAGQNAESIASKTLGSALETLDLYGIDEVLVEQQALQQRGLSAQDLIMPVKVVAADVIADLIARSDLVVNL